MATDSQRAPASSLLGTVTDFYLSSRDFNGIPARTLMHGHTGTKDVMTALRSLVTEGALLVVGGPQHDNPHIRHFAPLRVEEQLRRLDDPDTVCVYPSPTHLQRVVDVARFTGRPFTLALALGEAQLDYRAFDMSVLERYRNDPRYHYSIDDVHGSISASEQLDASGHARDSVLIDRFGFAYNEALDRAVAVFLRDLQRLTPEHQQHWKNHELDGQYALHPAFYASSIRGEWYEGISIFEAFLMEMRLINELCVAIGRLPLFRNVPPEQSRPRGFGFLIRPTQREYHDFVQILDKLLSESIDKDFFRDDVPLETDKTRADGKIIVEQKGTLQILDDWLQLKYKTPDRSMIDGMIATLRRVRKERQKPAHALVDNVFDQQFLHAQRDLMIAALSAVNMLRQVFARHPRARRVAIPEVLEREDQIYTR